MRRMTIKEAAETLGVGIQRIHHKLKANHFPHAERCECGLAVLIPVLEVYENIGTKRKRKKRSK